MLQELTICYLGDLPEEEVEAASGAAAAAAAAGRRALLREQYLFECGCARCST